ncbi:MAG: YlbF family regulator [Ignavibacteriaceae bacterium]|nr:YlbF family regulator [Ignavibacteriaceae bacterium]
MDQLEEIMQKSTELGKSIAHTPMYQEFKKAEYDLLHNPVARKLIEDLQKMKQEHYGKQAAGIEVSNEEQDTLKKMEFMCLKDSQVLVSNDANSKFQEFMEQITKNIKEGIKSVEK